MNAKPSPHDTGWTLNRQAPQRVPVQFLPPPPGAWGWVRLKNQGGPRVEPTAAQPQPQERRFSINPEGPPNRIGGKPALRPTITLRF